MWINTKSIFEWNSRLKKYVEIHNEGFDYDGEMMLMGQCTGQPNHSSCFPNGICWQGRCHHGGGGSRNYMPNPYLHFVEKRKSHEKHGRAYTLATCSPPLSATLATGTACQTGVSDFCPIFLRFGSPFWDLMGPGAHKLRKWTPGGGGRRTHFSDLFSSSDTLGAQMVPGPDF